MAEIRLVTYATLMGAGLADYVLCARMLEPAQEQTTIRLSSSLRMRRLHDYTNLAFEALVIAATLIPVVLIAFYYRSIPAVLPAAGSAEWAQKKTFDWFSASRC
jgi:hypothetical protein